MSGVTKPRAAAVLWIAVSVVLVRLQQAAGVDHLGDDATALIGQQVTSGATLNKQLEHAPAIYV
ncbi:hypothetical protein [Pseudidiomarina salilacus]|uniref:hypothetical protein n=1 Tax=Pseudidiomarina salilacus TaxID=3384452 RepID=UPI003984CAB7